VGTPEVNNGVKLEAFIFDAFEEAGTVQLFEVDRIEEFCPMKNLTGEDSLESGNKLWLASQEAAAKTGKLWSQIYPGEQCLL
jgi:UDP-N-acetylglucosamine pyrophosphorylase